MMNYHQRLRVPEVLLVVVLCIQTTTSLVLERERLPGIWKLVVPDRRVLQDFGLYSGSDDDILLKLNGDGSFRQCNEGYAEGRWIRGCWECTDHQENLLLAMDRQYYGKPTDTLLVGRKQQQFDENDIAAQLLIQGEIFTGKFMHPKNHPAFFDSPMLMQQQPICSFRLLQVLSSKTLLPSDQPQENTNPSNDGTSNLAQLYTAQDFYGKHFFMTIVPVGHRRQLENQPADIRAMPIQFFPNNTFSCRGVNKILRGRFVVQNDNKLLFEVSLFGAGRSAPGSVYSEGIGLSHEDKRNYIGTILTEQHNSGRTGNSTLRVEGSVTFGSDLGSDARPEPVGKFILKEISKNDNDKSCMLKDDDDFLEDDLFSHAFQ